MMTPEIRDLGHDLGVYGVSNGGTTYPLYVGVGMMVEGTACTTMILLLQHGVVV